MVVHGLLGKAAGTVVTGLVGVSAYEVLRKALDKAPLHDAAVTATEWSLRGTRRAEEAAESARLKLADVVVTEAGFGADLGAEKFIDIKCRQAGLKPACAVVVATVRALKMHGGVARNALGTENVAAVRRGVANLERHVENLGKFGLPVVVGVNHFTSDTEAEFAVIRDAMAQQRVEVISCTHWGNGGEGAEALADAREADRAGRSLETSVPIEDIVPDWPQRLAAARGKR